MPFERRFAWFFAMLDALRKIALVGIPAFFSNTKVQSGYCMIVSAIFFVGMRFYEPFIDPRLDKLQSKLGLSLLINYACAFVLTIAPRVPTDLPLLLSVVGTLLSAMLDLALSHPRTRRFIYARAPSCLRRFLPPERNDLASVTPVDTAGASEPVSAADPADHGMVDEVWKEGWSASKAMKF